MFLVDDDTEVVARLREELESHFVIVGTADSGKDYLRQTSRHEPHVVVLDVSMPGMSGVEVAERAKRQSPNLKIVMLSAHGDQTYVTEAFGAGASAYVLKPAGVPELIRAIREVQAGNRYLSPSLRVDEPI